MSALTAGRVVKLKFISVSNSMFAVRFRHITSSINSIQGNESMTKSKVRPFSEIPGPPGLPILGNLLTYRLGQRYLLYHQKLLENYKKYGTIYKEKLMGDTKVHLFDPLDVEELYRSPEKNPHTSSILLPSKFYREKRNMALGLGNTNGEEWYHVRSAVQPMMMKIQTVNNYLPLVNPIVNEFLERLKHIRKPNGHVDNFANEVRRWNLESAYNTFMETRLGCLRDDMEPVYQQMADSNPHVFDSSTKFNFSLGLYKYISTTLWRDHVKTEDTFFRQAQKLLDAAMKDMTALAKRDSLNGRYLFLSHLFFNTKLTYEEISTTTISFTFDGMNATVPTMIFILYCLAKHPDIQEKLYKHVTEILPDKTTDITPAHLSQMQYLKHCIKETLRLFPNGTEITRVPQIDVVMQNYHIPAGTKIDLHMNVSQTLEKYVPRAKEFIPERWDRDNNLPFKTSNFVSIPFGFGNRMCIGRRISEQELQILTARFIQNFQVRWPHKHDMEQRFQLLLFPSCEPDFQFIPRD